MGAGGAYFFDESQSIESRLWLLWEKKMKTVVSKKI